MNAIRSEQTSTRRRQPSALHMLAHLLEQLDRSPVTVGAEQYLSVVRHLSHELATVSPNAGLEMLLASYPAAAELYENLHYQHAGLCRTPLEPALQAELKAKDVIQKARHTSGFTNRGPSSGKN